jgi:uncharacterized phosphosugar-binding protein
MTNLLTFPDQLDRVKAGVLAQEETLVEVAELYAEAIANGGLVHVYANGHSRLAVEEMVIRMGALTGFHPILAAGFVTFTDVIGPNGIRINQGMEKFEGVGAMLLDEIDFGPHDVLIVISATGTTGAAVDMALAFNGRYPHHPLVALTSFVQARDAKPKHSSGKNLYHIVQEAERGYLLDNCMPLGDVSVTVEGEYDTYHVCPLSSIGALTIVQSMNELTIRALDRRGVKHHVLQNMHLGNTQETYDAWVRDQRQRYALATYNPNRVEPFLKE